MEVGASQLSLRAMCHVIETDAGMQSRRRLILGCKPDQTARGLLPGCILLGKLTLDWCLMRKIVYYLKENNVNVSSL